MLYPLKFHPIFKDKIWGGEKIRTVLKKDFSPLPNCGESWEISGVKNNESVILNGHLAGKNLIQVIDSFQDRLLGKRVFKKFGNDFPLLIKFIDAREDLSIQVHPDDRLALKNHNSFGKTEMWYILDADEDAELITGFSRKIDCDEYLKNFRNGTLLDILNKEKAFADDVFFIPSGRIHNIGKGLLLAEIQQSSDVTYRIFDFNRKDTAGNKRELHTKEALDAIDFNFFSEYKTRYEDRKDSPVELIHSKYFTTNKLVLRRNMNRRIKDLDTFVIYICIGGNGTILFNSGETDLAIGEVVLIPAELTDFRIQPEKNLELLETYITV